MLRELNRGTRETANLAEALAIDPLELLGAAAPDALDAAREAIEPGDKITKLTKKIGEACFSSLGARKSAALAKHPSDTVRSWACYAIAANTRLSFSAKLDRIRPLADDPHFGVREWAWIAIRDELIEQLDEALALMTPWTVERSANLRRFASEATRPRGVWCAHIRALREDPAPALPILEPLRSDQSKYVQDSVANWLNDASKDRPEWVVEITDRWLAESSSAETARIVRRARRTLDRH